MTAHRIDDTGTLGERPVPIAHSLEWSYAGHWGLHNKPDVEIINKKFQAKWAHTYLITGTLSGLGTVFTTAQVRTFYAKVEGTKVWETPLGAFRNGGPADSIVETAVPILGLWSAPDDRLAATLVVGMTRGTDSDWELGQGLHRVDIIDLGVLA